MTKDDLYNFIEEHMEDHGHEPTMVHVRKECHLHPKEAYALFNELVDDGRIEKLEVPRSSKYVLK